MNDDLFHEISCEIADAQADEEEAVSEQHVHYDRGYIQALLWVQQRIIHHNKKAMFTQEQIDHICYQIGDWYLMMKPLLEGQHNLGYMKEKLKTMICGE